MNRQNPSASLFFRSVFILLCSLSVGTIGCKPAAPAPSNEIGGSENRSPSTAGPANAQAASSGVQSTSPSQTGAISGLISFAGKPPVMASIDTSMDPVCSLAGGHLTAEQVVVSHGNLANVFVYVKSGPPAAMHAAAPSTQPVVLDQKNCQYLPHVIGVMQGGSVEFRNSDPTMHNIHTMPTEAGNQTIDFSEGPRGAAQTKQMMKPELMMPVRCNMHPWMNAFINISTTPFFAVSDPNGHFDIRGLPPGDYVLGAVHETLGEKTLQITVAPHTTAKADFSFSAK